MRKQKLLQARNEALIKKFHELYDVKRIRLEDVLRELSEQHFFMDENYIYALIFYNKKNNQFYESLLKQNQSCKS
jgi:hypothetical protein